MDDPFLIFVMSIFVAAIVIGLGAAWLFSSLGTVPVEKINDDVWPDEN